MMNRRSGVKMFLSVITAPIVLAHLINFLIRKCYVSPPMLEKFILQIWSAMPIQDMNTSAPIYNKGEALKKLAALHLFVETLPIYKTIATGNRNNEFYRETTRSNCK
jgi:hypothetical protein